MQPAAALATPAAVVDQRAAKLPLTPGEEGLRDVRLMTTIYEAARAGKSVRV